MRELYRFGYGEPDCKVYQYWNQDFPVSIKGADYSAIVLHRNGKMLLVVCNYGKGATVEIALKDGFGPKGEFRCSDNTAVTPTKNGCSFFLPDNDYRILTME